MSFEIILRHGDGLVWRLQAAPPCAGVLRLEDPGGRLSGVRGMAGHFRLISRGILDQIELILVHSLKDSDRNNNPTIYFHLLPKPHKIFSHDGGLLQLEGLNHREQLLLLPDLHV